jgi:hypothetical protein
MPAFDPVPQTVAEQIILWERETDRLSRAEGILIENIPNLTLLERLVTGVREAGVYLWHARVPRPLLLIRQDGKADFKRLWEAHRSGAPPAGQPGALETPDAGEPLEDLDEFGTYQPLE